MNSEKRRIFAKDADVSNNTWETGLNNNDIIIGPSGAGKTTGYVIPNITQQYGSMIVTDTKGNLSARLGPSLKDAGYEVYTLDFVNQANSCVYNPLDYIGRDVWGKEFNQQELMSLANLLIPTRNSRDPYWEDNARIVIISLMAFVLEALPREEQHLGSVVELFRVIGTQKGEEIFAQWEREYPDSFAVKKYKMYRNVFKAEKTWECIRQMAATALEPFDYREARNIFCRPTQFAIGDLGKQKAVLFINVSDTDRTFDRSINAFYSQALDMLCKTADANPNSRLKVPVRIIMDDFAANTCIPHFDKTISVIRSRDISVSIILQSLTQLESMYTYAEAATIINNCDHMLYLGGQDLRTVEYIGTRANKTPESILSMQLDKAYLFTRGQRAKLVEKVNPFAEQEEEAIEDEDCFLEDGEWDLDALPFD